MADAPITGKDLVDAARDSLYVTVGLGVLAFQRAQVRRQELTKQFSRHVRSIVSAPTSR